MNNIFIQLELLRPSMAHAPVIETNDDHKVENVEINQLYDMFPTLSHSTINV